MDHALSPEQFFDTGSFPQTATSAKALKRQQKKAQKEEKQRGRSPATKLVPRNEKQADYIWSLENNSLSFGIGPAGVGKTYVPARVYGSMLASGEIKKIYLARPNVSKAKHRNGFLPGTMEEKTDPWLVPIFEGLKESLGTRDFEEMRKNKVIEEVPYEFIQGRTFKDAACIVDEAENLDHDDLYITLTRQGEGLLMCLCGDIYQARIPNSGLADVIEMSREDEHDDTGVIEFTEDEVVRSKQAAQWVKSFKRRPHLLGFQDASRSTRYRNDREANDDFKSNPPAFMKAA